MYRGSGIKRDQVTEDGIPCVRYGEIYTPYNVWFDSCISHTDPKTISGKKYFEYGDVLFAITGESVDEIAKSCVYVGDEKCLAGGDIVVMKHNENPKYIAYALSTVSAQAQKSKGKVKSKVVHSSVPALKEIVIPIPPLEEQERIVSILDRFDTLCNDITAGLPAEIEARKKQYEYYRDKLLSFKELKVA
jgi:type I restriction enzyme S subunit